jgi:hypothetical protein
MHKNSLKGHVWYFDCSFSVRTNVICQRFLFFLIVDGWGSVEVSCASENAGETHSIKSLMLLLRDWLRSFCFNRCDLHIGNRRAWVLWTDAMNWRRDGEDMIPRSQPNMFLRFFRSTWPYMLTFCFA